MINPFKDVNWNPDLAVKRAFAKSLVIGFPCVALGLFLVNRVSTGAWHPKAALWLGSLGLGLGVVLLALPMIAKPFYLVWYFIGCCIGIVVSNVLLGGFFYLVITPGGWLKRLLGRQNMQKTFDKSAATYWKDAEKITDAGRYYRQF